MGRPVGGGRIQRAISLDLCCCSAKRDEDMQFIVEVGGGETKRQVLVLRNLND